MTMLFCCIMQAVMDALLVDEFKLAGENIVERDFEDVTSAITTEPTWSVVKKWGTAELEKLPRDDSLLINITKQEVAQGSGKADCIQGTCRSPRRWQRWFSASVPAAAHGVEHQHLVVPIGLVWCSV